MMKCECGSENFEPGLGEHTLLGLDSVRLVGVPVRRCAGCGRIAQAKLAGLRELERLVTNALVRKRARLAGAEFRWLRKRLRLKGTELARLMGVGAATISRWETGAAPVSSFADRLLRAIVAQKGAAPLFDVDELAAIDSGDDAPLELVLEPTTAGWFPSREARAAG